MGVLRAVLTTAAGMAAVLVAGAAPAAAAPPVCATPADATVRTGALLRVVPSCGVPMYASAVYTITSPPQEGSVRVTQEMLGYALRYLPSGEIPATDAFAYTVTTADGTSAPVTQHITISPDANTLPTCSPVAPARVVRPGTPRKLLLSCSDADGDALSVSVVDEPDHADVELGETIATGRAVTVTAHDDDEGADSFTFRASDGRGVSAEASVSLQIATPATNTAPSCTPLHSSAEAARDGAAWVTVFCQDPEGDAYEIDVDAPAHGTASGSPMGDDPIIGGFGRQVTYVPPAGWTGETTLKFRARDTHGATSGDVSVTVKVVPPTGTEPPTCFSTTALTVRPGTTRTIGAACVSFGLSGLELKEQPEHGSVAIRGGRLVYTAPATVPNPATVSFTYRLLSSGGASDWITQPITLDAAANQAPSCGISVPGRMALWPDETVVRRNTNAPVRVGCYDPDGDPVTIDVHDPAHGSALGFQPIAELREWESAARAGTYTPDPGYVGFDELAATAGDGRVTAATSLPVAVRSVGYNTAPSCDSIGGWGGVMVAGGEAEWSESCRDAEGDAVGVEVLRAPDGITFTAFTPDEDGLLRAIVRAAPSAAGLGMVLLRPADERGASLGEMGRSIRVIADPGDVDRELPGGGSAGSPASALPTPANPASVRVTTLDPGRVTIATKSGAAPSGYSAFGLSFAITAPDAIPEAPLQLRFRFDASLLRAGDTVDTVTVFRNGDSVPACTGPGATPDPCVTSRRILSGGDLEIVALSSKASTWSFGRALPTTPGEQPAPIRGDGSGAGLPPAGVTETGGVGETLPPPAAKRARRPTLSLGKLPRLRAVLARGIRLTVTSPAAGTARARLTLDGRTAKRLKLSKGRAVVVAKASAKLAANRRTTTTLRFTKAARRALAKRTSVSLKLQVSVGDGPVATKTVKLRR